MTVDILNIRPVEGRRVTAPETLQILTRPLAVRATPFWLRRIADGDVEPCTPEEVDPAPLPSTTNRTKKEG